MLQLQFPSHPAAPPLPRPQPRLRGAFVALPGAGRGRGRYAGGAGQGEAQGGGGGAGARLRGAGDHRRAPGRPRLALHGSLPPAAGLPRGDALHGPVDGEAHHLRRPRPTQPRREHLREQGSADGYRSKKPELAEQTSGNQKITNQSLRAQLHRRRRTTVPAEPRAAANSTRAGELQRTAARKPPTEPPSSGHRLGLGGGGEAGSPPERSRRLDPAPKPTTPKATRKIWTPALLHHHEHPPTPEQSTGRARTPAAHLITCTGCEQGEQEDSDREGQ